MKSYFFLNETFTFWEIVIIGNKTLCRPILSLIKLLSNRLPLSGLLILFTTRMVTERTPLNPITIINNLNKTALSLAVEPALY